MFRYISQDNLYVITPHREISVRFYVPCLDSGQVKDGISDIYLTGVLNKLRFP
jgi:hypothetical protein